jgi:hypothetical protein
MSGRNTNVSKSNMEGNILILTGIVVGVFSAWLIISTILGI